MKIAVIGPAHPYRSGIATHTTRLAHHLRKTHTVRHISYSRQYPRFLFPGKSDRDGDGFPPATEFIIDSLNPITWYNTAQSIKKWQPDHLIMPWWHPYWTAVTRTFAPDTIICHNVLPHEPSAYALPALKFALKPAAQLVAHAESDAALLRHHFPAKRITTTPHPTYAPATVGTGLALSPLPESIPTDRPLLLFCGLIRPYKGLDILLQALPHVLDATPVHLAIVGESWGDTDYNAQIDALGIRHAITFINEWVDDDTLNSFVKAADAVVLPYKSASQSGIVQLAFGLGTPVICTAVGGLPDVVTHESTGLLVPPNDGDALAQTITRYLSEGLKQRFQKNIEDESQRFSWDTYVTAVLS